MNQSVLNILAVGVAGAAGLALLWPHVRSQATWRATVTPLASIIGSGFLVVAPILAGVAGPHATLAMVGLCALAWLFGAAVRFNIVHAEPLRDATVSAGNGKRGAITIDLLSEFGLSLAYFISVAYYLNLLGAYLLKGVGIVDPTLARIVTSAIIVGLGALGMLRGFRGIERVEVIAVSFKLAVIAGILAALAAALASGHVHGHAPPAAPGTPWHAARVLLGCVILVQGFETSRFLGRHYDAAMRVRTMRRAQLISTVIYAAFIALVLPHVPAVHPTVGGETEVVDILTGVASVLGPLLVVAAVASQLSAAMADIGGAGGLLHDLSQRRLSPRMAYGAITAAALLLTWSVDIFDIIAFASRAFAVYYTLQCALAWRLARGRSWQRLTFGVGAALALAVVVLGIPVD